MAINLDNSLSIRTGVRNSITRALKEVLQTQSLNFADISSKAISAVWKPTGINRRYFLSLLGRVVDLVNSLLADGKKFRIRSDMFKATMTFREMLDKLASLVSKLRTS